MGYAATNATPQQHKKPQDALPDCTQFCVEHRRHRKYLAISKTASPSTPPRAPPRGYPLPTHLSFPIYGVLNEPAPHDANARPSRLSSHRHQHCASLPCSKRDTCIPSPKPPDPCQAPALTVSACRQNRAELLAAAAIRPSVTRPSVLRQHLAGCRRRLLRPEPR